MKKNSSFQLKSGNNLGASATKLMKQSPVRKDAQNMPQNQFANVDQSKGKPNLKDRISLDVREAQNKLESDIKGFFGNIRKGFKTAADKRRKASEKRQSKIDQTKMNIENTKKLLTHKKEKVEKGIKKFLSTKPTAGKGGTKGMQEKAKKFKFF